MVKLVLGNIYCTIVGEFHSDASVCRGFHEALRKELSYLVPDVEWSPLYKQGVWDGRISLYKQKTRTFPTGCSTRVVELFKDLEIPFKIEDKRTRPEKNLDIQINLGNRSLRFYQEEAVSRGIKASRGMLAVGTGGGKTILSCKLLSEMGVGPVIFIVPSKSLLHQTHEEFEKYLTINGQPAKIGKIGDGIFAPQFDGINICTYQTLLLAYNEVFKEKAGTVNGEKHSANTVIVDPFSGDNIRKTTPELKQDAHRAEQEYQDALSKAQYLQSPFLKEKSVLTKELQDLLSKGSNNLSKSETKRIIVLENKIEKVIKSSNHVVMRATTKLRQSAADATAKYNSRIQSEENKKLIREIVEKAQGYLVDEAHVAAVVIEALGKHAKNAYYRFGITATPYREDNQQIRMEGTFGRILIKVSSSDLIDLNFLVKPFIRMIPISHVEQSDNYTDAYNKHIVNNWERNYRIKQIAEECKSKGYPTIILVDRLEHGVILESMIKDSMFVAGGDKGEDDPTEEDRNYRRQMLDKTQRNEQILIATQWANVGIDAPYLTALILAGSGTSMVTTMQQIGRVLRIAEGKSFCLVFDFMSEQEHLHDHCVRREKIYRSESAFDYKRIRA